MTRSERSTPHAPGPSARPGGLADQIITIETPELVSIDYPLAGLGSRFAALLVDALLLLLLAGVLPLLALVFLGITGLSDFTPTGLLLGAWVIYTLVLVWGYFIFFEGLRDGQTPGKRRLSIRVVMDGGYPVTFEAAAIRNLIRFVDIQPFPSCLFGGFAMLVGSKAKRLGDFAAGTVVVRELPITFPPMREIARGSGQPRLSDEAYRALELFIDRHDALTVGTRRDLARRVLAKMPRAALDEMPSTEKPAHLLRTLYADETARRHAARLALRAGSPAAAQLLRAKRDRWEGFRKEVRRLRNKGLRAVGEHSIGRFAARYRELSADLSRARTYGASRETLFALERLTGAAHNLFYRPARKTMKGLGGWVMGGFPRTVRRLWLPIAVASLLLWGPAVVSFCVLRAQPELETRLVSADMITRAEKAREAGTDYRDTWGDVWLGSTFLSSSVIANNIQVSFLAFAGGALAGLGTLLILVTNGLHLGSALAVFANRDVLDNIGLFILPHGVIEMTAITIVGGAGLWMGSAFILPGRRKRIATLVARARDAASLVAGVVMLLLVAGLIEGFVSPARIPVAMKLGWAALAAAGLVAYLLLGGRRRLRG